MSRVTDTDTIAAIATPAGEGAIAIVRISGPSSIRCTEKIFRGSRRLSDSPGYTVHHGKMVDLSGNEVDDVLVTLFRSPNSYTGEDSVEIGCHGGSYVSRKVLRVAIDSGARQAEPGEFTKRAFLNGKIDLLQAEAIAELIASQSERMYRISLDHLEGRFSSEIAKLRNELLNISSLLELGLDFSEEGIDVVKKSELLSRIAVVRTQIQSLISSYRLGRIYRDGVSVVIVGRPNAGKSSLFNALLRENRAIVTEVPGTTRDHLEESISLDGVRYRLTDTAGLRDTDDIVEREGVIRARRALRSSDIVVLVEDAARGVDRESAKKFVEGLEIPRLGILAYNKADKWTKTQKKLGEMTMGSTVFSEVAVSALTGIGIDEVVNKLMDAIPEEAQGSELQVTSLRHKRALENALSSLVNAEKSVVGGFPHEIISLDIREASNRLGEIIGEVTTDDVLNNIFSHFCIGK